MASEHFQRYAAETGVIGLKPHLLSKLPQAQQDITREFARASTHAECYTCLVTKVPKEDIRKYLGRGHMPSVALKSPFKRNYGNSKFACDKCDTWSRMETLLTCLPGANQLSTCHLTRCILDLRSMLPDVQRSWVSIRKHNCPLAAWAGWLTNLTVDAVLSPLPGYNVERIRTWTEIASAQKRHAINTRVTSVRKGFKSWLQSAL